MTRDDYWRWGAVGAAVLAAAVAVGAALYGPLAPAASHPLMGGGAPPAASGSFRDWSGTVVNGGTSQQVCGANPNRRMLVVVNDSNATLWVNFGGAATQGSGSVPLAPASTNPGQGGALFLESGFISTESVNIVGGTTGQAYTVKEGSP